MLPDDATRLERLEEALRIRPATEGAFDAVRALILDLAEDYETGSEEFLQQARLVLATPSVHARSLEHQAAWEAVIRAFAAGGTGRPGTSLLSQVLAGRVHGRTSGGLVRGCTTTAGPTSSLSPQRPSTCSATASATRAEPRRARQVRWRM